MRRAGAFLACLAITSQLLSAPAAAHSSVAEDPQGDAIPDGVPAYYDIVKAKVHADDTATDITFSIRLAEDIPALPATTFLAVNWVLETDTTQAGTDWNVVVRWCSRATHPNCQLGDAHWEASVRNLHTAAFEYLPSDSFTIDGRDVSLRVTPTSTRLGNTTAFTWFSASRLQPAASAAATDTAPDTGVRAFSK